MVWWLGFGMVQLHASNISKGHRWVNFAHWGQLQRLAPGWKQLVVRQNRLAQVETVLCSMS
jgi:hypothetical protein